MPATTTTTTSKFERYPRVGAKWGRLECTKILAKSVMLPKLGGGEYASGEWVDCAIQCTCQCGTVFEFPIEKWPGKNKLRMCQTCKGETKPLTGRGNFPARLEPNCIHQLYLPASWKSAITEIYVYSQEQSKNVIFESRIRKLYDLATERMTPEELQEFLKDPLYRQLEVGRLLKSQQIR